MNKEIEMKNEEKETMGQSLLWIGSVVDKYKIDLRDCTGQELVDTLILVANDLLIANDPKKEDSQWKQLSSRFGSYIANQTCPECFGKIDSGEIQAPEVETHYTGDPNERYRHCIHCECMVFF